MKNSTLKNNKVHICTQQYIDSSKILDKNNKISKFTILINDSAYTRIIQHKYDNSAQKIDEIRYI